MPVIATRVVLYNLLNQLRSSLFTSRSSCANIMSDKHLTKGSPLPPYTGKLRLYNMRFCPYAQRAVLILNAKNVPYEIVNINLTEKPEWLTTKSPFGKVPALEVEENLTVYESLVIADYLDDKYPDPQLVAKDPLRKALDKLIVENFGKCTTAYYKNLFQSEEDPGLFFDGLDYVEAELKKRSSKYLSGEKPGMVDYMIWPWFERFGLLPLRGAKNMNIDEKKYPLLTSWTELMKKVPAVQAYYLDLETHNKFIEARLDGSLDCYDILL